MNATNQPTIKAINTSTQCILHKLFFAWVALGFYLPLQPSLHAQQVQLRGTVAVHNSKYETGEVIYVQNAYLSAPFTVPATSDVEGNFVLEFVGLASGTALKIEAEKAGLEVVNTRELEEVVIGRKFPLRIYVAEKGKLAQAQTQLYQISKQALFARRDALIARLRADNEESQAVLEELEARFGQELSDRFAAEDLLRKKMEEQEKQLPKFAMELAKKNLDNASQLYIQAYELFKEGKIAEVIALLDEEKLQASREQTKQATAAIKKEKALLVAREEQNQQQIQQLISTFTLKADALALAFRYAEVATQYRAIIGIHVENELPSTDLAGWYDKLGQVLLDNGTYPPALEAYQKALTIREEVFETTHPDLATSYGNIGRTYWRMGRYEEALEYQQKALAIEEEVLDATHPDLAASYNNIGLTYSYMGRYDQALEYQQKTLAIDEEVLDAKHPDLAISYNNIGLTYESMGRYEEALEYHQKALAIAEEVLDAKHPFLAISYDNIGGTYSRMGRYEEALEFHQKALAIREEVLDATHPDLATSYSNIGLTYSRMGRYEEALEYQQKALAIDEEVLDAKHPFLAISYNNIAVVYSDMGRYEEALEYHQKALAIEEEVLDAKHPSLAISYGNIGLTYESMGRYEEALEYHQKALAIAEEVLDAKHPSLAISYGNIAVVYSDMGRYEEALEYQQKALTIREEVLDAKHPLLANSYSTTAAALTGLQQYKAAQEFLQKAIAIFKEKNHPYIITAYGRLGLVKLKLGTTSKAQEYFSLYNELAKDKDKALGAYYQALYHTVIGDLQKALDFLEEAIARGYTNRVHITQEELLAPLHKEARYQALVESLSKDKENKE